MYHHLNSFMMVRASDLYPKKPLVKDSELLVPPFSPIPGEDIAYLGSTRDGVIALSNYRLHITTSTMTEDTTTTEAASSSSSSSFINIPLGLIELVEQRDLFFVHIYCKDARYFRIQFQNNSTCEEWLARLLEATAAATNTSKITDVFAFAHFAWALEENFEEFIEHPTSSSLSSSSSSSSPLPPPQQQHQQQQFSWFHSEIARLRFDVQGAWRISNANKDYKLCPTYPEELLIPFCISDAMLEKIAQFRSARRIPAVLWRHAGTGAVLARCSQPEVGWLNWRSTEDEQMVKALADACAYDRGTNGSCIALSSSECSPMTTATGDSVNNDSSNEIHSSSESSVAKKVLIIDARSYAAAFGNRARGGGVECPEYYPNTEIVFMSLANIHSVRKSFHALRSLCNMPTDQASWFQALDGTRWLHHLSGLLKAAIRCTTALEVEGRPVIVHCSDGWDRTPQIVSLSQLFMDPYYRTIEGFQVLVEKEWLDFGHKMADRCGLAVCTPDVNERSPIFLQWLDCVHQLLLQFPCHFEFNLSYLVKLVQHAYSSLFGSFLCNSQQERRKYGIPEKTRSVWAYLQNHPYKFRNFLYQRRDETLWPRCEIRDLLLWKDVYVSVELRDYGPSGDNRLCLSDNSNEGSEIDAVAKPSENNNHHHPEDLVKDLENLQMKESEKEPCSSVSLNGDAADNSSLAAETASERSSATSSSSGVTANVTRRVTNPIESSADTLVPEGDVEERSVAMMKRSNGTVNTTTTTTNNTNNTNNNNTTGGDHTNNAAHTVEKSICNNGYDLTVIKKRTTNENGITHLSETLKIVLDKEEFFTDPGINQQQQHGYFQGPLDSDGLVSHHDEAQKRLVEIVTSHRTEIQALKRDLYVMRMALCRHQKSALKEAAAAAAAATASSSAAANSKVTGGKMADEEVSNAQSGVESAMSELSWEAVDERETKPTLWVPDHAATACMGCKTEFWFGRRKHHCRSCGRLFCNECSDRMAPIPTEQLYHPVRVCDECYEDLKDINDINSESEGNVDKDSVSSSNRDEEKIERNKRRKRRRRRRSQSAPPLPSPQFVVEQSCL